MLENDREAADLYNMICMCKSTCHLLFSNEAADHLQAYEGAYAELDAYEIEYTYRRGIITAQWILNGLCIPDIDAPLEDFLGKDTIENEKIYAELSAKFETCFDTLQKLSNKDELAACQLEDWQEYCTVLSNRYEDYAFISGLEYGLFLGNSLHMQCDETYKYIYCLYEKFGIHQ